MSDRKRSLIVVFKGGPNHGLILSGPEAAGVLIAPEGENLPAVGSRTQASPYLHHKSRLAADRERVVAAWKKIGYESPPMPTYEVESVEDDVLVYAYRDAESS